MRVEEDSSSLELFLQKTDLKEYMLKPKLRIKVQKVEGEAPTPQVLMQKPDLKIKVKHVEEQVDLQKPYFIIKLEHVKE